MKHVIVPAGEFTFRSLCTLNPTIRPVTLLKLVTEQVTEGKLIKKKIADNTPVTYQQTETAPDLHPDSQSTIQEVPRVSSVSIR